VGIRFLAPVAAADRLALLVRGELRDLLNTLAAIAERGARFRSLGDTWADTTTAHGRCASRFGKAPSIRASSSQLVCRSCCPPFRLGYGGFGDPLPSRFVLDAFGDVRSDKFQRFQ
jgi:hypothetical protein